MGRYDIIYDKNEIDRLCQLYLEGQLTLKEEQDLAIVLSHIDEVNSEAIDETLFLMGISRTVAKSSGKSDKETYTANAPSKRKNPFAGWLEIGSVAAVVVVALTVGWNFFKPETTEANDVCEVYAFGKKITDKEKSRQMAMESYNRSLELLARMQQLEKEKMSEVENARKIITHDYE